MISPVDPYLEAFAKAGADIITVHVEAGPHTHRTLQKIRDLGKQVGVTLNPGTPIASLESVIGMVDVVLVMSVNPGFGGQAFIPEAVERVKAIRQLARKRPIRVEVDGGVTPDNAGMLTAAGADTPWSPAPAVSGAPRRLPRQHRRPPHRRRTGPDIRDDLHRHDPGLPIAPAAVALITGASSGLGARMARVLAASGAKVALAARRTDRLQALAEEIKVAGGRAHAVAMDVTDEASVIAGFDGAEAALGPVDTVFANAGMNNRALAAEITVEAWDEMMAINVRGVFLTAREGARRMMAAGSRETGRGRIILISSIGALKVLPGLTAYCTSKAAVLMMGKSLAREWANRGINVNTICPGYVLTELNADWFGEEGGKKQIAGFPRRRLMDEEDLDAMALYLASDASRAITGSVFTLDDGQTL